MHRFLAAIIVAAALVALQSCARTSSMSERAQELAAQSRLIGAQQRWVAVRWHARNEVLSGLSAPHRTLLSTLIGQLSVAAQPDLCGAIRRLDAALDGNEKASIGLASRKLQASWQPLWDAERAAMLQQNPATRFGRSGWHAVDPGSVLLDLTTDSHIRRHSGCVT